MVVVATVVVTEEEKGRRSLLLFFPLSGFLNLFSDTICMSCVCNCWSARSLLFVVAVIFVDQIPFEYHEFFMEYEEKQVQKNKQLLMQNPTYLFLF